MTSKYTIFFLGRGSGATRYVYSAFWSEVYVSLFIGENKRVPFVRYDLFNQSGLQSVKSSLKVIKMPAIFLSEYQRHSFASFYSLKTTWIICKSFRNYLFAVDRALLDEALEADDDLFFQGKEMIISLNSLIEDLWWENIIFAPCY